jgi:hypothetical protein
LDLGKEVAGGSEDQLGVLARILLEAFAYIMESELKVGSGGNSDLLCRTKPFTKPD